MMTFKATDAVGMRVMVIDEHTKAYKDECAKCGIQYDWFGNTSEPQITCGCGHIFKAQGKEVPNG